MDKTKKLYHSLCHKIIETGSKEPKRHGDYYTVSVFDDYTLQIDSWNKSIEVRKGNKRVDNIGIDFGGFRCNETMTKFWLGHSCLFALYK